MQQLTIRTFGETDVRINDVSVKWRSDSVRVLFLYLLSHPNGRSRQQIIDTLWHTDPDVNASGRFRVVVYRLRAALQSHGAVLEDHSQYRLEPAILNVCDAHLFTVAVENKRGRRRAARLSAGCTSWHSSGIGAITCPTKPKIGP